MMKAFNDGARGGPRLVDVAAAAPLWRVFGRECIYSERTALVRWPKDI